MIGYWLVLLALAWRLGHVPGVAGALVAAASLGIILPALPDIVRSLNRSD